MNVDGEKITKAIIGERALSENVLLRIAHETYHKIIDYVFAGTNSNLSESAVGNLKSFFKLPCAEYFGVFVNAVAPEYLSAIWHDSSTSTSADIRTLKLNPNKRAYAHLFNRALRSMVNKCGVIHQLTLDLLKKRNSNLDLVRADDWVATLYHVLLLTNEVNAGVYRGEMYDAASITNKFTRDTDSQFLIDIHLIYAMVSGIFFLYKRTDDNGTGYAHLAKLLVGFRIKGLYKHCGIGIYGKATLGMFRTCKYFALSNFSSFGIFRSFFWCHCNRYY